MRQIHFLLNVKAWNNGASTSKKMKCSWFAAMYKYFQICGNIFHSYTPGLNKIGPAEGKYHKKTIKSHLLQKSRETVLKDMITLLFIKEWLGEIPEYRDIYRTLR